MVEILTQGSFITKGVKFNEAARLDIKEITSVDSIIVCVNLLEVKVRKAFVTSFFMFIYLFFLTPINIFLLIRYHL